MRLFCFNTLEPHPEEAANGSRGCAPDDRLRGRLEGWVVCLAEPIALPQPLIPDIGGLGGGGFLRFGVALRTGHNDNAAPRYLMPGIGRHLVEEVGRNR